MCQTIIFLCRWVRNKNSNNNNKNQNIKSNPPKTSKTTATTTKSRETFQEKWNEAFVIVQMVLPVVLRMNDFYLHEWLKKMAIYFIMYFAQKSYTFPLLFFL